MVSEPDADFVAACWAKLTTVIVSIDLLPVVAQQLALKSNPGLFKHFHPARGIQSP
jgi:hypothetical protein